MTVLIVESDSDMAILTKKTLEDTHNLEAIIEPEPDNVLEKIQSKDIDCIVSEYDLPNKSGIDLLKEVREHYPKIPFIIYTGKGSETIAKAAINAGATDYLIKRRDTDTFETLSRRIKTAVQQVQDKKWKEKSLRRQYVAIILAVLSILIGLISLFLSLNSI